MGRILFKGEAHKAHVWTTRCDICGSILFMYEEADIHDPFVTDRESVGNNWVGLVGWRLEYKCPVCERRQNAYFPYEGQLKTFENFEGGEYMALYKRCETERKEIVLTNDDREEIAKYKKAYEEASDE